jgi:hypothetical protein
LQRIILSATLVALTVTLLAVSSLASTAQEDGGQYASDDTQYVPTTTTVQSAVICAPWSKSWDISKGQWYYDWYRWCVDPSLYDPAVESSWYIKKGNRVQGEPANLCPEKGNCTVSPEGGMRMSTTTDPADTQPPTTTSPTTAPTDPVDTQTPTTSPSTTPTDPVDTQTPTSLPY